MSILNALRNLFGLKAKDKPKPAPVSRPVPPRGGTGTAPPTRPAQRAYTSSSPPTPPTPPADDRLLTGVLIGHILTQPHHSAPTHPAESTVTPPPSEAEPVLRLPALEPDRTWGASGTGADWSSPPPPPPPPCFDSGSSYDSGSSFDSGSSGGSDW